MNKKEIIITRNIDKYTTKDWNFISSLDDLTEDFIREYSDKVNWVLISRYQILSEDFILEFRDKVDWDNISLYQILSESFIREYPDKVNWIYIFLNPKLNLSQEFKNEFRLYLKRKQEEKENV